MKFIEFGSIEILDKIFTKGKYVGPDDFKNIFEANCYKKEAVEKWLVINKIKLDLETSNLFYLFPDEIDRKCSKEFKKLNKVNINKHNNILNVFFAYKEYFNVNENFNDCFNRCMNTDYGKAADEIYSKDEE